MPALIPKEVEIQRLKKIYIMVIMLGSIAASVEVDNFVDGSLHQTTIRDSAFTPAHWWLYSHFIALPLGWGFVAMYDRRVPILRGPNNSMNTGLKITIIGYLATMFTIGINELWHFWFVEEIFSVPNHWCFNMGVVVAFMGALAYVVRVYARLVELGAETPAKNPYDALPARITVLNIERENRPIEGFIITQQRSKPRRNCSRVMCRSIYSKQRSTTYKTRSKKASRNISQRGYPT